MDATMRRQYHRSTLSTWCLLVLAGWMAAAWTATAAAAEAPRISPAELKSRLGDPDLVIVDVRVDGPVAEEKIPGAAIEDWRKVAEWASRYPKGKTIVLYCS